MNKCLNTVISMFAAAARSRIQLAVQQVLLLSPWELRAAKEGDSLQSEFDLPQGRLGPLADRSAPAGVASRLLPRRGFTFGSPAANSFRNEFGAAGRSGAGRPGVLRGDAGDPQAAVALGVGGAAAVAGARDADRLPERADGRDRRRGAHAARPSAGRRGCRRRSRPTMHAGVRSRGERAIRRVLASVAEAGSRCRAVTPTPWQGLSRTPPRAYNEAGIPPRPFPENACPL